jgi:ABC-type transporter Mla MlaB component
MAVEPTEVKTILLTGPITLYEVAAVRETLRMALAEGKQLRIDLADSGPWDLAGLQLLVSCVKTARSRDREARLINVPGTCAEVAERAGLSGWLRSVRE